MFLCALYMFRVFITHPQERHCKLGRRFDNLSMLVVVSYNTLSDPVKYVANGLNFYSGWKYFRNF
jgi:hypothetical protein